MFKKETEINDLCDISLVNPDEEKMTYFNLIFKILNQTFKNIITILLIIVCDNVNIILVNKESNDYENILNLQYAICIIYIVLLLFSNGIFNIISSHGKQRKLYFESLVVIICFGVFLYLPFSFLSYFISPYNAWRNYLIFSSFYIIAKLSFYLNVKLLELRGFWTYSLMLVFLAFLLQISLSFLFINSLKMGLFGAILSKSIAYLISLVVSFYVLRQNICKLFLLEMQVLKKCIEVNEDIKNKIDQENIEDLDDERKNYSAMYSFYLNLEHSFVCLFYYNKSDRLKNETGNDVNTQEKNQYNFISKEVDVAVTYKHHDHNNFLKARKKSKEIEVFDIQDLDELKKPLLVNECNHSHKTLNLTLFLELFSFIVKSSFLSCINYLGFGLIIIFGHYKMTQTEQVSNLIIINIISFAFIISYGISLTLIEYISIESFTHSHANKYKYTKLCCFIMLFICMIISILLYFFPAFLANIYVSDLKVNKHVIHIILWYVVFIYPHFASIILDSFIVAASENSKISLILSLLFSIVIMPSSMIMYLKGFSYLIVWYAFLAYNLIHLISLLIYMLLYKIL